MSNVTDIKSLRVELEKTQDIKNLRIELEKATDQNQIVTLYKNIISHPDVLLGDYLKYAIYLRNIDVPASLQILQNAQTIFSENAWIEDNRARALLLLNQLSEAIACWEKAILLSVENEKPFFSEALAEAYRETNRQILEQIANAKKNSQWDEIISIVGSYQKQQLKNAYLYLELTVAYRSKKDFTNAINILKEAEKNGLNGVWLHDNYARVFFERKLYRKAIKASNKALQLARNNAEREMLSAFLDDCTKQLATNQEGNRELELIEDSLLFDEEFYLFINKDINASSVDPLEHFTVYGWKEGRNPNKYFSLAWYAKRYSIPTEINPLLHYINTGCRQLLDTSKYFCTEKYFTTYKNQINEPNEPLAYFLNVGRKMGHTPFAVDFDNGVVKLAKKNAVCPTPDDLNLYAAFKGKQGFNGNSKTYNPKQLNIHWIIPDFSAGSGGHMTIFRLISYLERFGHSNTIWITGNSHNPTSDDAYKNIIRNFQFVFAEVRFFSSEFYAAEGDAVIATGWNTVWGALSSTKMKRAFYLVQDYEPLFYPAGSRSLVAEETYRQDIDCICASPWLAQLMKEKHKRWASHFLLSYDAESYYPKDEQQDTGNTTIEIAAYYRPFTDRRAVELVLMGLEQLAKRAVNFRVHFFGNHTPIAFDAPFEYMDHGILTAEQLGKLYRKCDVGLTFSATNYSLIPQEMMACSLPVIELDTDCCRAVFPENTISLANYHPSSIADAITRLTTDKALAQQQVANAHQWIKQFNWETAAKTVEKSIVERLEYYEFRKAKPNKHHRNKPEVSVVIPTYNAGELFKTVLDTVLTQRAPWHYEVIVIDSSSTDGTAEYAQSKANVVTKIIPKSEFQHGRTRNLGAELAQGDYIAFITQDAQPASEYWLYYLISALKKYPKAAGVFGKHLPWNDASPFTKRDFKGHFEGFDNNSICVSRFTDANRYNQGDEGWQQFLRFYSDNNSAMRKDVWRLIPYPEIEFGEDQAWASAIIQAGYEKVYSTHGLVYHSHNYGYKEQFVRAYEEFTFFKEQFGLLIGNINSDAISNEIKALNDRDIAYANINGINDEQLQKQLVLNKGYVLGKFAAYIANSWGSLDDKLKLLENMLTN